MKHLTLLAAAALCLSLTCHSQPAVSGAEPGQWTMDLEAARQTALEKKLPIFINFTGSDWCVWCKHMEKEVFSTPAWLDYARDSLLMVWIDFPQNKALVPEKYTRRNQQLAQLFGIEAYPAYIVLDDDGKTQLGELEAEQQITPARFITQLNAVLIERAATMNALIAGLPADEAQALQKAWTERTAARAELQQLQNRQNQLAAQLTALETTITALRTAALTSRLAPEQAARYRATQSALTTAQNVLTQWTAANPPQTPENTQAYTAMQKKIADLENQSAALLYVK